MRFIGSLNKAMTFIATLPNDNEVISVYTSKEGLEVVTTIQVVESLYRRLVDSWAASQNKVSVYQSSNHLYADIKGVPGLQIVTVADLPS